MAVAGTRDGGPFLAIVGAGESPLLLCIDAPTIFHSLTVVGTRDSLLLLLISPDDRTTPVFSAIAGARDGLLFIIIPSVQIALFLANFDTSDNI